MCCPNSHTLRAARGEGDAERDRYRQAGWYAGSHLHLAGAPGVLHLDPLAIGHACMVVRRTDARLLLWRMQAHEVSVPFSELQILVLARSGSSAPHWCLPPSAKTEMGSDRQHPCGLGITERFAAQAMVMRHADACLLLQTTADTQTECQCPAGAPHRSRNGVQTSSCHAVGPRETLNPSTDPGLILCGTDAC